MKVYPLKIQAIASALVFLLISDSASAGPATSPTAWLLQYEGKSTNQLIWDKRFVALVNSRVPPALSDNVAMALGGPPDPVVVEDHRYVSMSACRPHSCTEKGFLWIDAETGMGIGAFHVPGTLRLASNSLSAANIPPQAKLALSSWIYEQSMSVEYIEFIDRSGAKVEMPPKSFSWKEKFQPPSTGPAFDCTMAQSKIEKTICADTGLAAQDLAVSELYHSIRLGSGTTGVQEELRSLQRKWLQQRDRECLNVDNLVDCLKDQYTAQYKRLNNWLPASAHRPQS
ncbi:lysozyme inhibitor LprI family protein [Pseudoduganella danionis]|nr:lysozyme inhibitor LprI family protein [Pseudoduganella danionis]